jgi:hypothetical protein
MAVQKSTGIFYWTWFDCALLRPGDAGYDPAHPCTARPRQGCAGGSWQWPNTNQRTFAWPSSLNPSPQQAAGLPAKSACFVPPICYSSADSSTAQVHASFLEELGIDFVIYDATNGPKGPPYPAQEYCAAVQAMQGFRNYANNGGRKIRSAFMLGPTMANGSNSQFSEDLIFDTSDTIRRHIVAIAAQYQSDMDSFFKVDNKPLLLFYLSAGNNVTEPHQNTYAFPASTAHLIPDSPSRFLKFTLDNATYDFTDIFSVRYALVANDVTNYAGLGFPQVNQIWPFTCFKENSDTGAFTKFAEVGYAAVFNSSWAGSANHGRDVNLFNELVTAAIERDLPYILIRGWNEFSTGGDEPYPFAWTLEPNTELHKYDTTPGNSDAYYFFHVVKSRLNRIKVLNGHAFSQPSPAHVLVGDYSAPGAKNVAHEPYGGSDHQKWCLRRTGDGYFWFIIIQSVSRGAVFRVLDLDSDGINVIHAPLDFSRKSQQWKIVAVNGGVKIVCRSNEDHDYVLEADKNGTNVQIGIYDAAHDLDHQRWIIEGIGME